MDASLLHEEQSRPNRDDRESNDEGRSPGRLHRTCRDFFDLTRNAIRGGVNSVVLQQFGELDK